MTTFHADGSTCMADFWEQSARLLTARAEKAEAEHKAAVAVFNLNEEQRDRIAELEVALEMIGEDTKPWHTCDHAQYARDALDKASDMRFGEQE